ncbi:MAG: hypothetical protein AABZ74_09310 [Cyanobacteriota bacterium]
MLKLANKKITTLLSALVLSYSLASCSTNNATQELLPQDTNISSIKRDIKTPQDAIKQFSDAYTQLKDFTGVVTIADSKSGDPADAVTGDSKFFFKKDRNERVEITKSTDAQKQGTLLAYKGGDKVQIILAKAIPILGKKFTLAVTDKKIGTSRGVSFDQLDLTSMLNRFNKAGVTLSLVSSDANSIKISGAGTFKGIDSEVTNEILTLDAKTMLPLEDEVFVKNKTVLKISVADLKLNVGLKDDLFTIF